MTLNDPKKNNPNVQISYNNVKGFVFKPHPDIDKQSWNKGKVICAADQDSGFPAQARIDAVRYRYTSKDEADLPFSVNVFNAKKGNKNLITLEVEANQNCKLGFQRLERVTIAMNLGGASDIEVVKKGNHALDQDGQNDQLLWHISDLLNEGNAVL